MLSTLSEKFNQPPEKITINNGIVQVNGQELTFAEVGALMREEGRDPKLVYDYKSPKQPRWGKQVINILPIPSQPRRLKWKWTWIPEKSV